MDSLKNTLKVVQNNPQYVIGLCFFIILFAIFCDGLLAGIITALSAFGTYVCIQKLYSDFNNISNKPKSVKSSKKSNKKNK